MLLEKENSLCDSGSRYGSDPGFILNTARTFAEHGELVYTKSNGMALPKYANTAVKSLLGSKHCNLVVGSGTGTESNRKFKSYLGEFAEE